MFPCLDEIVAGVPDRRAYLTAGRARGVHRPARRRASRDRSVVARRVARRATDSVVSRSPAARCRRFSSACRTPRSRSARSLSSICFRCLPTVSPRSWATASPWSRPAIPTRHCSTSPGSTQPYDLTGFLLRVYRPPLHDQFEWTFPVSYKRYAFTRPLPEAAAVMKVDRSTPARLLHAAAQQQLQRRVLLPLRRGRRAAAAARRRHGGGRSASALRRARGALSAHAGAGRLPRLRARATTTSSTMPTAPTRPSSSRAAPRATRTPRPCGTASPSSPRSRTSPAPASPTRALRG